MLRQSCCPEMFDIENGVVSVHLKLCMKTKKKVGWKQFSYHGSDFKSNVMPLLLCSVCGVLVHLSDSLQVLHYVASQRFSDTNIRYSLCFLSCGNVLAYSTI